MIGQKLVNASAAVAILVASLLAPSTEAAPIRLKQTTFDPARGQRPELPPGLTIADYPAGSRGYYIVQFTGPVMESWKDTVRAGGIEILEYFPDYAFKIRSNPGAARQLEKLDSVAWVGLFHPAYKLSPDLTGRNHLRIRLTDYADPAIVSSEIEALGATVEVASGRYLIIQLGGAEVAAIANILEVAWIEPEFENKLLNNIARRSSGGMDAYAIWNLDIYGSGQIVGIADTSLDTNDATTVHQDFRGRVDAIIKMAGTGQTVSTDTDGHGTHVAGSVLGNGVESGATPTVHDYGQNDATDPNVTTTKVTGLAPEANVYFQSILCKSGTLCGIPTDLADLFGPAYTAGARIHTNSWGASVNGQYIANSAEADTFNWNNKDMVILFAASNDGVDANSDGYVDLDSLGAPGTAKNVLTVGATENARTNGAVNVEDATNDLDEVQCGGSANWGDCFTGYPAAPTSSDPVGGTTYEELAAFSSRGPTDDGRIKPDVVAPGANILSTRSQSTTGGGWGPGPNGFYQMLGGTSMATPLTAGATALVRSWYQNEKGHATPSAALIKATLINTAVDIAGYGNTSQEAGLPIPNMHEGWGRVDLGNVADDARRQHFDSDSVTTGVTVSHTLPAEAGTPFKVSLVWTDYPGSTLAATQLVNDLDLVVTSPTGTVYRGNVFTGGWSTIGGSADALNNVECVYVQSAEAGDYTVEITGTNVPNGPQPFALVCDNCAGVSLSINDVTVTEGNGGTTTADFTVTLSAASASTVTVDWATSDGSATAGSDYTGNTGTLSFAPGDLSKTISITVSGDTVVEADETFIVTLSNPANAAITNATGTGTITNDDAAPGTIAFSAATYSVAENGTSVTITVDRTGGSDGAVTVDYATSNGTASAGTDYSTSSGTLSFADSVTSQTFNVSITEDTRDEPNETINLALSNLTGGATLGAQDTAVLTITDNDPTPSLSIDDVSVSEGDSGTTTADFTVTLSAASGRTVTIDWATSDGTATAGSDYTAANSSLTFTPGQISKTISITVAGDTDVELDEMFTVTLSNAGNATIADATGTGTITNDDAPGTLAFSAATYNVAENGTSVTITVNRTGGSDGAVTVDYATSNGTATAGSDYTTDSGTLSFADGVTSQTFNVSISDDTIDEPNETVNLALSNLTGGATLGAQDTAVLTITDNDPTPSLSIDDVPVTEGDGGTTTADFTVTLSAASGRTVTVDWATSDDTATAGSDYTAATSSLTFTPGQISKTVSVTVAGDTDVELDESFTVTLSNAGNATIADATGTGTITNDDAAGTLVFSAATYNVAENGSSVTITVNRTGGSDGAVTVDYATSNGTATAGSDYTAASSTLSFADGVTSQTFNVSISDDAIDEPNETINLALSNLTGGATLGAQSTAILTITDNDPTPSLSIDDVTVSEGDGGTTTADFTVTLSAASGRTVTVSYATSDGTATAGSDYTSTNGTLTFTPGQTSKIVSVTVAGDTDVEPNETFTVTLSNASNATIADATGTGTINNDDAAGTLAFSAATYSVAENGSSVTITVDRTGGSDGAVTVDYATSNGTATAGSDYTTASGTLSFADGVTSQTFNVSISDDAIDEPNETINLALSNLTGGATLGTQDTAIISITDNDPTPSLSIDDDSVTEGDGGTTTADFTVTLSAASGRTVTVDYATSDGTATAGSDYTSTNGTLTFTPGQTSKTVSVTVAGDTTVETDETFTVTLSNASNATIADATGTGTITNDDAAPGTLVFSSATYTVAENGTSVTITVNRTGGSDGAVTVDYATSNGTATAGSDYTTDSGTLSFADGVTSQTFNVSISDDAIDEPNETVNLALSNLTGGATLGTQGTAIISITDDDPTPSLSLDDVSVTEGDGGTTTADFTVTLSAASGRTVTVDYATSDGTASAGSDYASATGTLTFAAGETSKTFSVTVNGDTTVEEDETFIVALSGSSNASIADAAGTGTIMDDDMILGTVIGISPAAGTWLGGTTITISGSGFLAGSAVTIGGAPATDIVVVDDETITAVTGSIDTPGIYDVVVSHPSGFLETLVGGYEYTAVRFDPNGDFTISVADIFYLINYLFSGGPAPQGWAGPVGSGDANNDGVVSVADIFFVINYLFADGPEPLSTAFSADR